MATDIPLPAAVTVNTSGHILMLGLQRMKSGAVQTVRKSWSTFASFVLRDKVVEVAVGLMWVIFLAV